MSGLSAHGAAVLFGEHAAVYGHPALGFGLPRALHVTAMTATTGAFRLRVPHWHLTTTTEDPGPGGDERVSRAMALLGGLLPGRGGMDLTVDARIPMGAGLGSSAALSVLLVRALATLRGLRVSQESVRDAAHELERVFHGTPSGLDDSIATFGGLCLFRRGGLSEDTPLPAGSVRVARDLAALPFPTPPLLIGLTGVPRSTADVVARVRERRERAPGAVEGAFAAIDDCLHEGLAALAAQDLPRLGRAMNRNQDFLRALGVSCREIETLVESALTHGALGAKLTGAGGGGCVLALAPERPEAVTDAWRARGFSHLSWSPAREEPMP